jgi:hypothetical protein
MQYAKVEKDPYIVFDENSRYQALATDTNYKALL